jgi:hypothetical protein
LQPTELSTVVRPAFDQLAAIGTPAQSQSKTALQHLHGPIPLDLDPANHAQHQPSAYSILSTTADTALRHLGVPFAAGVADRTAAAFSSQPASMSAAGLRWQPLAPNLFGRTLVSSQCLASKAVYQANFHSPSATATTHMHQSRPAFFLKPPCACYPAAQVA